MTNVTPTPYPLDTLDLVLIHPQARDLQHFDDVCCPSEVITTPHGYKLVGIEPEILEQVHGEDLEECWHYWVPSIASVRHLTEAFFDMDGTLIEEECLDELARELGLYDQMQAITRSAMEGKLDFNTSFKTRMALLKGLSEAKLANLAQRVHLRSGLVTLIGALKAHRVKTTLISGGLTPITQRVAQRLKIDRVFANNPGIEAGHLTGEVFDPIVNGDFKKSVVLNERHLNPHGLFLGCGDGANDVGFINACDVRVGVLPKPVLAQATHFHFDTPEELEYLVDILG